MWRQRPSSDNRSSRNPAKRRPRLKFQRDLRNKPILPDPDNFRNHDQMLKLINRKPIPAAKPHGPSHHKVRRNTRKSLRNRSPKQHSNPSFPKNIKT